MELRGEQNDFDIYLFIYLLIVLLIVVMLVWNLFETDSLIEKLSGAIALIMFLLRLFLIK